MGSGFGKKSGESQTEADKGDVLARLDRSSAHLWFWQKNESKWKPFDADASDSIEARFINNPREKVKVRVQNQDIEVNLITLTQTNTATHRQRSVKRVPPLKSLPTRPCDSIEKDHVWQWNMDDDSWSDYGSRSNFPTSAAIEMAYASNQNCTICFHSHRRSYVIDLGRMTQTNETNGKERKLRRHRLGNVPHADIYPSTWIDTSDGKDFKLVTISPTGDTEKEYQRVADQIALTMKCKLTTITRIQNNEIYERFHVYKTQMGKRLEQGKGIRYLFHGPKAKGVDAICQQGFDCRVNGNCLYGKGSYFARDAQYASEYTDCNKLFMAQVLVGEYILGKRDILRPPPKKDGYLFDSCVNNMEDPSIFVVFDCAHSYPEYLIEFQKNV